MSCINTDTGLQEPIIKFHTGKVLQKIYIKTFQVLVMVRSGESNWLNIGAKKNSNFVDKGMHSFPRLLRNSN